MARIIVPVVTVFDHNGKPDYEANKKVADFLIGYGVDGILILGSTGEFTELSVSEKRAFLQSYADHVMVAWSCTQGQAALRLTRRCNSPTASTIWVIELHS